MIDIVTLACSIKHNGFCLVGKTINEPHNWIRLVSDKDGKELDQNQIQVDGAQISPFDVLRIDETKKAPLFYQPENIIFDQATITRSKNDNIDLIPYLDAPDLLWGNTNSSISETEISSVDSSLYLIKVCNLEIVYKIENDRPKTRASFIFNGNLYNDFRVTDPLIRCDTKKESAILCVSLGEPFNPGHWQHYRHYKIIARVFNG